MTPWIIIACVAVWLAGWAFIAGADAKARNVDSPTSEGMVTGMLWPLIVALAIIIAPAWFAWWLGRKIA